LVKGNAADAVINNPDIPNEKNTEVVAEATNTIASGLRNIVAGGGVQSLLSLFANSGGDKKSLLGNPIVSMMMGHFAGKLMTKYGLNNNQANNLSGNLIPSVLSTLINKSNDPNEQGFSLEKLIASITGNKDADQNAGGGIGDLLSQLSAGSQQNESGGGLMDIIKTLASGAQQQQQKTGSGGLMDLLKGFM
jgi:hypothetical protein